MSEAIQRLPVQPMPDAEFRYRTGRPGGAGIVRSVPRAVEPDTRERPETRPGEERPRIAPGYRVGKLTVVEATDRRRGRYMVWRCACDCGGEIELDTRYLQRGTVRDCGCAGSVGPDAREARAKLSGEQKVQPGYRVGKLTVKEATKERRSTHIVWRCGCDCGGEILLDTRQLRRGAVTSCGCEGNSRRVTRDLTGQRFGKLTVLSYTGRSGRNGTIWLCQCDCGRQVSKPRGQLISGYTKSCGCLSHPPLKDYIGRRFGRLVVTGYAGRRDGLHRWTCRCDCGRTTEVRQGHLQSGKTQSCGCLQAESFRENLKMTEGTAVTLLEHYQNHLSVNNTSGYNGVYKDKRTGKWTAQITFKGKTKYLGSYAKIEDAVRARWIAQQDVEDFLESYYAAHPEKRPGDDRESERRAAPEARQAGG